MKRRFQTLDVFTETALAGNPLAVVLDAEASSPPIPFPNGVLLDDADHLLIADFSLGNLFRLDLKTEKLERIGSGFGGTDGLAKDSSGRRFVGDWKNGCWVLVGS